MSRPRRLAVATLAGALAVTLAACGSQLNPQEVADTGGTTGVQAANGTTDGSGTTTDGTGTTGDTGTSGTGTTGDTGTTGTGSDPGTSDNTGTDPGSNPGSSDSPAPGSPQTTPAVPQKGAADCSGFKNGPGVTDSTITIGNSSDISGPVPGLFATAQDGTNAFVQYFNATVPNGICGRKLALKTYDSKTDAGADQQAYASACNDVFAMVGSQSAFDSGGASAAQSCGLPDIRASSVTQARADCSTCFATDSVNNSFYETAVPNYVKQQGQAAHVAFFYINAGAASENALKQVKAMEKVGLHFDVVQGISISEFNYAPYVQQLKDKGVTTVFWTGAYQQSVRLRQAMQQNGYTPKIYLRDPTDYNPEYVQQGGSAVNGTVVYLNFVPFEEAKSNPEMANYLAWLNQTKPGTAPQFFGVFAWSAAQLFVDLATQLGGKLTRASLIDALKKVNNWTANGMTAPQPVGSGGTGECYRFIQLDGSSWKAVDGTKYHCDGLTPTS